MKNLVNLEIKDRAVFETIQKEEQRQEETIELIASENATSKSVMKAQGSVFTNKYAEGYPTKRYYGGCVYADEIEEIAIERAKQLFGAEAANVQPHSGSQANMAVYLAELKPGDKVMGMSLNEGGHLTHGASVNFSGKLFESVFYGVDAHTGYIDYGKVFDLAKKETPKLIIAGASAYSRIIDFKKFREIADAVNATLVVDMAHISGLVAAGVHPSPVLYADYVTTTTHKTLRGPRGGMILCSKDKIKKINSLIFPGIQGGPLMHVIAAKAICLKEAMEDSFKEYQTKVIENARILSEALLQKGFDIISGGTDNHLILLSLVNKNITGKALENALDKANITLNKNAIPNDPQSPFVTSGVRIGTPTVTTREMGKNEMYFIADCINNIVDNMEDEMVINLVKEKVISLTKEYPLYR